ncbi:MAG: shikimate kinase AroL [Planctomycetota bacterium]
MQNIFLIGLRGSGKTTVGRLLAERLHRPFFDTDHLIAQLQGCSVAEVFHTRGEAAFRHLESQALSEICRDHRRAVVATGGGMVLSSGNREKMRANGLVIHLSAPPEILHHRIAKDPDSDSLRPSLTGLTGLDDLRATADKRADMYEAARHCEVAVADRTPEEIVTAILEQIPQEWE